MQSETTERSVLSVVWVGRYPQQSPSILIGKLSLSWSLHTTTSGAQTHIATAHIVAVHKGAQSSRGPVHLLALVVLRGLARSRVSHVATCPQQCLIRVKPTESLHGFCDCFIGRACFSLFVQHRANRSNRVVLVLLDSLPADTNLFNNVLDPA